MKTSIPTAGGERQIKITVNYQIGKNYIQFDEDMGSYSLLVSNVTVSVNQQYTYR